MHSPVWGGVPAFKMLVVTKNKIMMLKTLKLFQMTYLCRCGYVSERGSECSSPRLFNTILETERMPEEYRSLLVPVSKNKGDVQAVATGR